MVKIQLDLPEKEDNELKHYMIDNKIEDKRVAIIKVIRGFFKLK